MAFSITKLHLSETAFNSTPSRHTFEYILEGTDLHPKPIYEWLRNPSATWSDGVVQWPDESYPSSASVTYPLPETYGPTGYELPLDDIELSHFDDTKNKDIVRLRAIYSAESSGNGGFQAAGSTTFSFDIGPDNETVKQSYQTITTLNPTGGTAKITNRGINLDRDGLPQGVQIPDAASQFSLELAQASAFFTSSKLAELNRMRGKVNNATFQGLAAGEVRFIGASGTISSVGNSSIQLRFGVIENQTGQSFPGLTGTYDKEGWDYFWVYYGYPEDADNANKPSGGYVERVLLRDDLNTIFT